MVDLYRKRIARTVIEMAKEDPDFILTFIKELEKTQEIEAGELDHIKRIALKWKDIAQRNLTAGKKIKPQSVSAGVSRRSFWPAQRQSSQVDPAARGRARAR